MSMESKIWAVGGALSIAAIGWLVRFQGRTRAAYAEQAAARQRETLSLKQRLESSGCRQWPVGKVGQGHGEAVLVAGGTGYLGEALIRELSERGYAAIVLSRDPGAKQRFPHARVLLADVCRREDLERVFAAHDIRGVITLLSSRKINDERQCHEVDYLANHALLEQAASHGVTHFIHLSDCGVYRPELHVQFHKLRIEGELLSGAFAPLPFTIVRPTAYYPYLSVHFEALRRGGAAPLTDHGEYALYNPIAREDLAEFVTNLLFDGSHHGQIYAVGGPWSPDNLCTLKSAAQMMFEALEQPAKLASTSLRAWDFKIGLFLAIGQVIPLFARIGTYLRMARYWSLTSHIAPAYGTRTLRDYHRRLLARAQGETTFWQRMRKGSVSIPTDC